MDDRNSEFLTQGRLWPFLHSRGNGGMWGLQQFSRQTISWPLFVIHISFFFSSFLFRTRIEYTLCKQRLEEAEKQLKLGKR